MPNMFENCKTYEFYYDTRAHRENSKVKTLKMINARHIPHHKTKLYKNIEANIPLCFVCVFCTYI